MISLIIPTKNRLDDLMLTLRKIAEGSELPDEIIIVDQSGENHHEAIEQAPDLERLRPLIRYHYMPEINGLIPARNFGIGQAGHDMLAFLDDDITVAPDYFRTLRRLFAEHPELDAVCAVDTGEESLSVTRTLCRSVFWLGPFWDIRSLMNRFHHSIRSDIIRANKFSAGYMTVRKAVIEDIGFDQALTGQVFVGDIDFSYRAAKKYRLAISPKLKTLHRGGISPSYDLEEGERKRVHARRYFYRKNVDKLPWNWLAYLWLMFGTVLSACARAVKAHSVSPVRGLLRGLREN